VKAGFAWLVWLAGCGFHSSAAAVDAGDGIPDAAPPDMAPPDMARPERTRLGLIGLWELDEIAGTTIADTSDVTPKVPLTIGPGMATFSAGTMTPIGDTVISSAPAPHFNRDVMLSGAVTLEAWVSPALAQQGAPGKPVVVSGLSASINARNISLLQDGKRWVGRVRTTVDVNGGPDLSSATDVIAGAMTHLVIVSDATQRILYVNGRPDYLDPTPSAQSNWDQAYKMVLGDESSGNRQWAGTFALVAIYQRALTAAEVQTSYEAGPDAR
jgi:hypothetical protein